MRKLRVSPAPLTLAKSGRLSATGVRLLTSCFVLSAMACSGAGTEGSPADAGAPGTIGTGGSGPLASTGGSSTGGAATGGMGTVMLPGTATGGASPPASGGSGDSGGSGATMTSGDAGSVDANGGGSRGGSSGRADAGAVGPGDAVSRDGGAVGTGVADGGAPAPTGKFTVYIVGDSTVSQYVLSPTDPKSWAGWGQMVQPHYDSQMVTVLDKAVGGMTARHFILGGNLAAVLNVIKAGDYLLVQFGTNDSNMGPTFTIGATSYPYFADANTDFKTYLQQYIDGARAKNAIPVLVTPPPRNSAYCGGRRSLADYGQAMIDLGVASKVPVIDLGAMTWGYLTKICPKPASGATETFFKVTGTAIDGTHFQENGARVMAGFVADGVAAAGLGLDAFRIN